MRIRTIRLRNESRSVRVCTIRSVELSHLRLSAANLRRPIPQSPASAERCGQPRASSCLDWFLCDPPYPPLVFSVRVGDTARQWGRAVF